MLRNGIARVAAAAVLAVGAVAVGPAASTAHAQKAGVYFAIDNNCSYSVTVRYKYNGHTYERRVRPVQGYFTARITSMSISTRTDNGKWMGRTVKHTQQVFTFC